MNSVELARELAALAQSGLHFTADPYDRERYERLQELSAELMAARSDFSREQLLKWSREDVGYATPKIDVRALIVEEGKVFLIREDADDGRWTLPGGWADVNLPPSENIIREVREESGYEVRVESLMAVLDREKQGHQPPYPYHVYKLFFHCTIVGGAPQVNLESSACGFFDPDDLPELSTRRVKAEQIHKLLHRVEAGEPEVWID